MDGYSNFRARGVSVVVSLALGLALASCATGPTGPGGSGASQSIPEDPDSTLLNGLVEVTVVDQRERAIARATVELTSLGKMPYRVSGTTNADGKVEFRGVPVHVEVRANSQVGAYSGDLDVLQTGVRTVIRVMVQQ